ncbi:MAG: protein kinase, partial [archaeon]|nr:protein kinase [archaeon]
MSSKNEQSSSKRTIKIIENFELGKQIGEGTFGKVKVATHMPTGEKVAIKILEKDKIEQDDAERISREIKFLKELNHPNIIKIYQIIDDHRNYNIIMELANGGELFNYIVKHRRLHEDMASIFYMQIIQGLSFMHQHCIVHRDIKPENLLLKEDDVLTIIDFGLSNKYKPGKFLRTSCGSPCYAAPEMIKNRPYNGLMVDIWSSGIVLYAMVCGYLPFEHKNNMVLYDKILSGNYELPDKLGENVKDLIRKILVTDPKKRIKMEDILQHPFLDVGKKWYSEKFGSCLIEKIHFLNEEEQKNSIIPYINTSIIRKMEKESKDLTFEEIKKNIMNNRHNSITTTYYLLLKKLGYDYSEKEKDGIVNIKVDFTNEENNNIEKERNNKENKTKEDNNKEDNNNKEDTNIKENKIEKSTEDKSISDSKQKESKENQSKTEEERKIIEIRLDESENKNPQSNIQKESEKKEEIENQSNEEEDDENEIENQSNEDEEGEVPDEMESSNGSVGEEVSPIGHKEKGNSSDISGIPGLSNDIEKHIKDMSSDIKFNERSKEYSNDINQNGSNNIHVNNYSNDVNSIKEEKETKNKKIFPMANINENFFSQTTRGGKEKGRRDFSVNTCSNVNTNAPNCFFNLQAEKNFERQGEREPSLDVDRIIKNNKLISNVEVVGGVPQSNLVAPLNKKILINLGIYYTGDNPPQAKEGNKNITGHRIEKINLSTSKTHYNANQAPTLLNTKIDTSITYENASLGGDDNRNKRHKIKTNGKNQSLINKLLNVPFNTINLMDDDTPPVKKKEENKKSLSNSKQSVNNKVNQKNYGSSNNNNLKTIDDTSSVGSNSSHKNTFSFGGIKQNLGRSTLYSAKESNKGRTARNTSSNSTNSAIDKGRKMKVYKQPAVIDLNIATTGKKDNKDNIHSKKNSDGMSYKKEKEIKKRVNSPKNENKGQSKNAAAANFSKALRESMKKKVVSNNIGGRTPTNSQKLKSKERFTPIKQKKSNTSLHFPLDNESENTEQNSQSSQGKSSLCTTTSTKEELLTKLNNFCTQNKYELSQIKDTNEALKFICSKENNYVGIEIKKIGRNNVLFLQHM